VKSVYMQCVENRALGGRNEPSRTEELTELHRLADDRTSKWESVLLLGNPDTVAAAGTWHRLIWRMELVASGEPNDAEQWVAVRQEIDLARARFCEAARRDLGIRSGPLPRADPWTPSMRASRDTPSASH
jgi:hypothetical protein